MITISDEYLKIGAVSYDNYPVRGINPLNHFISKPVQKPDQAKQTKRILPQTP